MAKLKTDFIQEQDLKEFLESYSDFSFELSVLKMLREKGLECEHGGVYEDPVTGKSREFDIRALKTIGKYRVRLAIECKNIRDNFPVLISCIPRHEDESYHQIAFVSEPRYEGHFGVPRIYESRAKVISIRGNHSLYKPGAFVGKSTVQVGRALDGSVVAHDNELFDKWSQCLSSTHDLVTRTYWDGDEDKDAHFFSSIFPVVVIPNGRLWVVEYDSDGNRLSDPYQTARCSCFVDKSYEMGTKMAGSSISISHVEIMTYDGLKDFEGNYLETENGITEIYSEEGIKESLEREKNSET